MGDCVYVNGEVVPREDAKVSPFDRGFLYGDGLFETIRAYAGVPFMLDAHLHRMGASAAALGIPMPERAELGEAVTRLIELNQLGDAYVRITVTRGLHTGALAPAEPAEPTVLVEARKLHPYPPELYANGATVVVSSLRHDSDSPLRRHKTTNYLLSILAKREARERGADEALLLDAAGHVAEGTTSNIFCVRRHGGRDSTLLTPPLDMNILPGITRATVLDLAPEAGIETGETRFTLDDLCSADEIFLTNSLMEVMPVRSVDDREFTGAPGPTTRAMAQSYGQLVARR